RGGRRRASGALTPRLRQPRYDAPPGRLPHRGRSDRRRVDPRDRQPQGLSDGRPHGGPLARGKLNAGGWWGMSDRILGIETSCDETAAAVVVRAQQVRSSVVASQIDQHARYGGVVPEIASRAHVETLTPVIAQALVESGFADDEIDAVAATCG